MFRSFRTSRRWALVAVTAAAASSVPAVAAAAVPEPVRSLVVNVSSTDNPTNALGAQLAFDTATDATVGQATATSSLVEFGVGRTSVGQGADLRLTSEPGHPLHTGVYVSDGSLTVPRLALTVNNGNADESMSSDDGVPTTFVIRDIASDSTGTVTRLDVVFSFYPNRARDGHFGELRYGEPEPKDHVDSATVLNYPLTPVGAPPIRANEVIDNTSAAPLAVSAAGISGSDAGQFTILSDGCAAGGLLAPGESCPVVVAYRPTEAGQHAAQLQLRIADQTDTVDLTGQSPFGYTGIITWGDDYPDGGGVHHVAEGETQWTLNGNAHNFNAVAFHLTDYFSTYLYMVTFSAPSGQLPTLGHHPFTNPFTPDAYGLNVSREGHGCSSTGGTLNVKRMDLAADGATPIAMDIAFALTCYEGSPGVTAVMNGEFLWRAPIKTSISVATAPVTYGHTAVVCGTAPAGAEVTMFAHKLSAAGYVRAGTVSAGLDGRWSFRYPAATDERLYGQVTGVATASALVQVTPTLSGAPARVVPRDKAYTLTGTGAVGSAVRLHFHRLGMAANDYSIVRDVAVSASGRWSRSYVANTDYRVYVTSASSGRSSGKSLLQAR